MAKRSSHSRDAFWQFARSMLRYRQLMAGTIVTALVSSVTLGIGILGAKPVLDKILGGDTTGLPQMAEELNNSLAHSSFTPLTHLRLPQRLIDALPTGAFTALVVVMGLLAALTVFGAIANFLHSYLSLTVVNRTITGIRRRAFFTTLRSPLRGVLKSGTADIISRIINDSNTLSNGLNVLVSKALLQSLKGIAGFAAALWYNWFVTLAALLVAPLMYTIIRKLGKRIRRAANAALESQSSLLGVATESLQALRVVKVYTSEVYEGGRFHRVNKDVMHELNRVRTARALASPLTETLSIFLLCALTLGAGFVIVKGVKIDFHRYGIPFLFDSGTVKPQDFVLCMISLAVAGASLKPLTGLVNDIQSSAPAADRLRELIRAAPEPGHGFRLPRVERLHRELAFKDVRLTYPGAESPAIDGVTLTIPHGKRIAFVGPNGCGKTTLLSLVPRLFDPDAGAVLIDGQDIRAFSVRSLRAQIGVVTQETAIFKGTIRANIAYGNPGADEAAILAAARKARAHDFIMSKPSGYDAPVSEQGLSLSGGQRQRLAIARAVLRDPAILILDEATSMVDSDSEAQISAALTEFGIGRTCLIVAHRLSTVLSCDSIVVMESGRIIDQGTHAELLSRCAVYQGLAQHQFPS